jgi:hypothetical protein
MDATRSTDAYDFGRFGRDLAHEVRQRVKAPLDSKIAMLEAKLAALESRVDELASAAGELKYVGIWRDGHEYQRGNFVTIDGSLWHCEQPTRSRPGRDSTWRLAVKKGTAT